MYISVSLARGWTAYQTRTDRESALLMEKSTMCRECPLLSKAVVQLAWKLKILQSAYGQEESVAHCWAQPDLQIRIQAIIIVIFFSEIS